VRRGGGLASYGVRHFEHEIHTWEDRAHAQVEHDLALVLVVLVGFLGSCRSGFSLRLCATGMIGRGEAMNR